MTFARSINKKYIITGAIFFENQYTGRNTRSIKKICRKTDYGIKKIKLYNFLANFSFTRTTKENTMRQNDSHTTGIIIKAVKHVKHKCIISLRTWWNSPSKSTIRIHGCCHLFFFLFI